MTDQPELRPCGRAKTHPAHGYMLGRAVLRCPGSSQPPTAADVTADEYEAMRRRAVQAEATIERMQSTNRMVNRCARDARIRAERAEAALARVRAVAEELDSTTARGGEADGHWNAAERIRAALDSQEPRP